MSVMAAFLFRGTSLLVVIVTIPLTIDLLGPVRFGLWMTIASVATLLAIVDLGLGYGVMNTIARADGENEAATARQAISTGVALVTALALVLGIAFLFFYPHIPWTALYNVAGDSIAESEAGPASAAFVILFLVGLPLGLVAHVRSGYQEGFIHSAFAGLGNLLTFGSLVLATQLRLGVTGLVVALSVGPLVAAALNWTALLISQRPSLVPRRSDVTGVMAKSLLGVGVGFLVLQLAYTISFSLDRFIVAQLIGPNAVAEYAVVHRLFSIPATLALIAVVPLWPAYREAIARHDLAWVRATLRRSLVVTLVLTVPSAVGLVLLGPSIVRVWTNQTVNAPASLYFALAAFTVALAVANVFSVLFNGAQVMRFLVVVWISASTINVILSVVLAQAIGVAGVAVGSTIAIVVALLAPSIVYTPTLLRRLGAIGGSR